MNKYKLSSRARRYLSKNEMLYYFETEGVVSIVLTAEDGDEIFLSNFITPDTIHFEGQYSLGPIVLGNDKKNKNKHLFYKYKHKFYAEEKNDWWENQGYVPSNQLVFC